MRRILFLLLAVGAMALVVWLSGGPSEDASPRTAPTETPRSDASPSTVPPEVSVVPVREVVTSTREVETGSPSELETDRPSDAVAATRAVTIVVLEEDRTPVEGASVHATKSLYSSASRDLARATTDASGRAEITGLPIAEFGVVVTFEDRALRVWTSVERDLDYVEITRPPAVGVAGTVVDATTRRPVPRFQAFVREWIDPSVRLPGQPLRPPGALPGPTEPYAGNWLPFEFEDARGRWDTLSAPFARGRHLDVEIVADGYVPERVEDLVVHDAPRYDEVVIALSPGTRVTGRVVERSSGDALVGAEVRVVPLADDSTGVAPPAITAVDGAYACPDRASGPHAAVVEWTDGPNDRVFVDRREIPAGRREWIWDIVVEPQGSIRGRVLDAAGDPDGSATVRAMAEDVPGLAARSFHAAVESDGRFEFGGLPPGRYRVARLIHGPIPGALENLAVRVQVVSGEVAEVDLAVRDPGSARITLVLREGDVSRLPDRLWATCTRAGEPSRHLFVDRIENVLLIDDLAAGPCRIGVTWTGFGGGGMFAAFADCVVEAGGVTQVDLRIDSLVR